MEPALTVAVLWLLFAGTHIGLATRRVRAALVARLGEAGFTALFSTIASASFAAAVAYYAAHRAEAHRGSRSRTCRPCAGRSWPHRDGDRPPERGVGNLSRIAVRPLRTHGPRAARDRARHAASVLRGPRALRPRARTHRDTLGGGGRVRRPGARRDRRGPAQDVKLLARNGRSYGDYVAATSGLPLAAVLGGRQRLVWRELPLGALAAGLGIAAGLRVVHGSIFAHGGLWVIVTVIGAAGSSPGRARGGHGAWEPPSRSTPRNEGRRGDRMCALVSRRQAVACAGAVLVAHVGLAHARPARPVHPRGAA